MHACGLHARRVNSYDLAIHVLLGTILANPTGFFGTGILENWTCYVYQATGNFVISTGFPCAIPCTSVQKCLIRVGACPEIVGNKKNAHHDHLSANCATWSSLPCANLFVSV